MASHICEGFSEGNPDLRGKEDWVVFAVSYPEDFSFYPDGK